MHLLSHEIFAKEISCIRKKKCPLARTFGRSPVVHMQRQAKEMGTQLFSLWLDGAVRPTGCYPWEYFLSSRDLSPLCQKTC